ncbi:MAG TPA: right-handed parallel beta-helix repeat-containing protein [Methanobacterium sp.]|jgi:hypothetical protein|nr:MAG: hypothetical protein FGO69_00200 [Methanobacterium sp.]HOI71717.1 right-handed parallel beta-helix repeat-containing protein [Methanobacterium sp.]
MKKMIFNRPFAALILILLLFFSFSHVSAAQWNVGTGQDYDNIQNAINNANTVDGDVINVFNGTYEEDVVVNKNLTIKINNNDAVTLKPTNVGFNVVNDINGNGGGTKITGFIINLMSGGLGMNISADYCIIENNTIKGGENGIITLGNNTVIINNKISDVSNTSIQAGYSSFINESGNITIVSQTANNTQVSNNKIIGGLNGIVILGDNNTIINNDISDVSSGGIAVVGCDPIISDNRISNIVGDGSKLGITVAALNLSGSTGLTMNNNILNNIRSTDNKTTGIDVFAMSMDSPLDDILVKGNIISNIYGIGSTAMSVVTLALKGAMSSLRVLDNTISNVVSQGINSTSIGIYSLPMGFDGNNTTESGNLQISKNRITEIKSEDEGGQSQGISYLQLIQGNSSISKNYLSEIKGNTMAAGIFTLGIDYTTFQSNMTIKENNITDITANNVTSGILAGNMGDMFILHNNIFRLDSAMSRFITAQPILSNITIMGNNLEGTGEEIGISVNGNNSTISYNRMVNFQYYIKNMDFLELIMEMYPITDEQLRDYLKSQYEDLTDEQLDEIVAAFHKLVDYINSFPSTTNAPYNWYGTNSNPGKEKFLPGNGTIDYEPWLILSIHANPSTIHVGEKSVITTDVYQDSTGDDHSANAANYFSGPQVTFTTDLGNLGSKSFTTVWINGLSIAILRGDEGPGIATVTATDYQTVQTFVTILGAPVPPEPVDPNIIEMQNTGIPITYVLMALILLFGGIILSNKK